RCGGNRNADVRQEAFSVFHILFHAIQKETAIFAPPCHPPLKEKIPPQSPAPPKPEIFPFQRDESFSRVLSLLSGPRSRNKISHPGQGSEALFSCRGGWFFARYLRSSGGLYHPMRRAYRPRQWPR